MNIERAHLPHLVATAFATELHERAMLWLVLWSEREYGQNALDPTTCDPMAN
jgi:hypothetical protein